MAVVAIPKSATMALVLSAGTDPQTGRTITKRVTYTGLDANIDNDDAYAVVTATATVLAHPLSRVETTVVNTLEQA